MKIFSAPLPRSGERGSPCALRNSSANPKTPDPECRPLKERLVLPAAAYTAKLEAYGPRLACLAATLPCCPNIFQASKLQRRKEQSQLPPSMYRGTGGYSEDSALTNVAAPREHQRRRTELLRLTLPQAIRTAYYHTQRISEGAV
jgi:hypothetical protein